MASVEVISGGTGIFVGSPLADAPAFRALARELPAPESYLSYASVCYETSNSP